MSNQPLQVSVIDAQTFQVAISSDSVKYKTELLLAAHEVGQVTNPQELEAARAVVAEIKKAVKSAEEARVALTKPFLDTQRALMTKADEWRKELDIWVKNLEDRISYYIRREQEREEAIYQAARAEERKRQEEAARVEREEQNRLAELKRQEEEAKARALRLKTKFAQDKAAAEALALRKQQDTLELERLEREPEPVVTIVARQPTLDTRGIQVRPTYEITVTDVHALYAWSRNLVTLEAKKGLLNSLANDHDGKIKIPGVEIKEVLKTNVRSAL